MRNARDDARASCRPGVELTRTPTMLLPGIFAIASRKVVVTASGCAARANPTLDITARTARKTASVPAGSAAFEPCKRVTRVVECVCHSERAPVASV